ncbi:adenosylmethionine--8-amino-7-oxononanoate transaminase [Thiolapillus sp.]
MNTAEMLQLDAAHIWHPYSSIGSDSPVFPVASAQGVHIRLADGRELVDGMSSWWCAIHGYNHPALNAAIESQLQDMAHVMFGGLTHAPAVTLARQLTELTPAGLDKVFFADSGSVAVEVAMKMAIQYWHARGESRQRFLSLYKGYHGDTFGAMSVCDPVTGMHGLFSGILPAQLFAPAPEPVFGAPCTEAQLQPVRALLEQHGQELAALILEPIVQGAGGMRFYSADYLRGIRRLCDTYDVLLIADEIATGFGRTGKLFACEWADISPDILCLGKSLTGGYLSLAATLTTDDIATTISSRPPGVFMHGPTFMANPLACAVAHASIGLLLESPWQQRISKIEQELEYGLAPCRELPSVAEVRVLGAIGVVELKQPVDMKTLQPAFVDAGVWVRPFGKLVYLMPAYVMEAQDLRRLCSATVDVITRHA